jgi:hypothetical protein
MHNATKLMASVFICNSSLGYLWLVGFAICCVPWICLLEMLLFIRLCSVGYRVRSLLYTSENLALSYFILEPSTNLVTAHEALRVFSNPVLFIHISLAFFSSQPGA